MAEIVVEYERMRGVMVEGKDGQRRWRQRIWGGMTQDGGRDEALK